MPIKFKNTIRSAGIIDIKIEINIIILNLARRAEFPIRNESRFINIISQTGHSRRFYKIIKKISIKIKSTINTMSI